MPKMMKPKKWSKAIPRISVRESTAVEEATDKLLASITKKPAREDGDHEADALLDLQEWANGVESLADDLIWQINLSQINSLTVRRFDL